MEAMSQAAAKKIAKHLIGSVHKVAAGAGGVAWGYKYACGPNQINTRSVGRFLDAERSMHSYLHITDPTLYRCAMNDKGLAQQVKLARAALAFVLAVQEVKAELGAAKETS